MIKIKIKRRSKRSLDWTTSNPLILNLFQASQTPKGSELRRFKKMLQSPHWSQWNFKLLPPLTSFHSFFSVLMFFSSPSFLLLFPPPFSLLQLSPPKKNHHDIFFIKKFTKTFLLLLSFALIQMMTTMMVRMTKHWWQWWWSWRASTISPLRWLNADN